MKILAFETSCDDTAVAIVENGTKILASSTVSQAIHSQYGGVVPELAARDHSTNWRIALEECLTQAKCEIEDIDFLAVTQGPGLQTSLLIGTTVASTLSLFFAKKLIPVQHIFGHLCSVFLDRNVEDIKFPCLTLTVSGGHTDLILWKNFTEFEFLGKTIDDACGEAFDKVAKMLFLGYPGGPLVSEMAKLGNRKAFNFPRILLEKNSLDFSFSGLKAAIYREIEKYNISLKNDNDDESFSLKTKNEHKNFVADICASFEQAVCDTFIKKIARILWRQSHGNFDNKSELFENLETQSIAFLQSIKTLCFVGGVSANSFLRENFAKFCETQGVNFLYPKKIAYSTDNAAMIASAAYFLYKKNPNIAKIQHLDADSGLSLV